jgi:hypothetical protein
VDCDLIWLKVGAFLQNGWHFPTGDLFPNRKCHGLDPWLVDQHKARSMVDRSPWPAVELTGAWPSSRSGSWQLAVRRGKEGGRHGDLILPNTEAWEVARGRRIDGGASAQNGDDMGAVGNRRRGVGGMGSFTGGGAPFYRAEVRRGVEVPLMACIDGASMSYLEDTGADYRRSEEGRGAV